ncbi:MAG: pyruvate, phosphate dikinase, partial [Planctomycetota bacterium]|nr:pyruvate, phosphate dikinase [Planctomycetota bacterium]
VLNIGLNDEIVNALEKREENKKFPYDAYRRLITMFGDVVMNVEREDFEKVLRVMCERRGVKREQELSVADMKDVVKEMKKVYRDRVGEEFPQDVWVQIERAILAVFRSWNNPRAVTYRRLNRISGLLGTAVNIQRMVFGNLEAKMSASGVGFTRSPADGTNKLYGEVLFDAQGEDVVAGIRTPMPVDELKERMPEVFEQLQRIRDKLERHYRNMQDIEFTVEKGKLYMLQTRTGKRTGFAAVKIALDMFSEGLVNEKEALMMVEPEHLTHLLYPVFDREELRLAQKEGRILGRGLGAGPGAASGLVVFDPKEAEKAANEGKRVILVRRETSPEDIGGMHAAVAIVTKTGGMTSHAAVVARGMGKTCVVGCEALEINYERRFMRVGARSVKEFDSISVDGTEGVIYEGEIKSVPSEVVRVLIEKTLDAKDAPVYQMFAKVMEWADRYRRLGVRANADIPRDAAAARAFGAEGIGLCRTEHMFFEGERIWSMRKMIMGETEEGRRSALEELLPMQRDDFLRIFRVMDGYPVTIRLFDPPLHEFLPQEEKQQRVMAERLGVTVEDVKAKVARLHEFNPMLGHRGCRLGITQPDIYRMQVRAIIEAALDAKKEGIKVLPEIMMPVVVNYEEMERLRRMTEDVAEKVFKERGERIEYLVGTMVETPRAAITADRIAAVAEFFSYGTNDLTQLTFAFSRDDVGSFLPHYIEKRILPEDPFRTLDTEGVGYLMRLGIERGRKTRKNLKVGICGEHGGDPESVKFCHRSGMNYVSCSPYRVPIAKLAAAHAALEEEARQA